MTDELWITLDAEAKLTYLRERLDGLGRVLSHLLERIEVVEVRARNNSNVIGALSAEIQKQ